MKLASQGLLIGLAAAGILIILIVVRALLFSFSPTSKNEEKLFQILQFLAVINVSVDIRWSRCSDLI
jgi:hypothetical protein